jgi:DNA-binding LytR/AlgR family response regulator
MSRINIVILEDQFIVAEDIRLNLVKAGYDVHVAKSSVEAIRLIKEVVPDLVLLDIQMKDGPDGIDTATELRSMVRTPFIYVTAHSDSSTFSRAKKTGPHAYIVKPFDFRDLYLAIELAIFNFSRDKVADLDELLDPPSGRPDHYIFSGVVYVKTGKSFQKVLLSDVLFIKAAGSYSVLVTASREFTIAANLHTVQERINHAEFLRVHRSYIVHMGHIDAIEEGGVKVGEVFVPVTKRIRDHLFQRIATI